MSKVNLRLVFLGSLLGVILTILTFVFLDRWMFNEGTRYANGYSEAKFNSIKIGFNQHQVQSLLPAPISKILECKCISNRIFYTKNCPVKCQLSKIIYVYTTQETSSSGFYSRRLILNSSLKVSEILKEKVYD
jgi:hypothetical protein